MLISMWTARAVALIVLSLSVANAQLPLLQPQNAVPVTSVIRGCVIHAATG